jgi:cation:H+ antiporter
MFFPIAAVIAGLVLLVWSADKFVEGSAAVARHFGVSPLIIGMVIVGFGTSVPEMLVSAISSLQGNPGIALGNAYGSNITNIALILGATAIMSPIAFHISVMKIELPILTAVSLFAAFQLIDGEITRIDAFLMIAVFTVYMTWAVRKALHHKKSKMAKEYEKDIEQMKMPVKKAFFWVFAGLSVLIVSSRMLVWGAVEIAHHFGVSDLIIGLTVVAIGTSLPELASSVMAARKGEHDIALGNIIGSNLFNTLIVVGIAGLIKPMKVMPEVLNRDMVVMIFLTVSLFVIGFNFKNRKQGRINRFEGAFLLSAYIGYTAYLILSVF